MQCKEVGGRTRWAAASVSVSGMGSPFSGAAWLGGASAPPGLGLDLRLLSVRKTEVSST